MSSPSPVAVETAWRRLLSIADESATALVRASFSSVIRDFLDYACVIFDGTGTMLVQSARSTPGMLGVLPYTVPNVMAEYPTDTLRPGDVLVLNDPWLASGHLIDITVLSPVFLDDSVVGYVVCSAHHLNVGGRHATIESRDMYEEGLKIPLTKLYAAGEPVEPVFEFIRANVREPDKVIGDLRAQVSANALMTRRVIEFLETTGRTELTTLGAEITARSEASMRAAIATLPDGTARREISMTIPGLPEPVLVRLALTIAGDELTLDFTGTSEQVPRAINCTLNMTRSYAFYILKCLLDPLVPNNGGCMRPVVITAPEGSVLNPRRPAATWGRTMIAHHLPELIMDAMGPLIPDRILASSGATPLAYCNLVGERADGSTFFTIVTMHGGMGAMADRDGLSCISFPANCANVPVEVIENESPLLIRQKSLLPDSGGAGRHRGGLGQRVEIEVLDGDLGPRGTVLAGVRGGRLGVPVRGVLGGCGAAEATVELNGRRIDIGNQVALGPGDVLAFNLPGGGGYGDPASRDPDSVAADIADGLVTS
ncbi:hydantoinase B/oxoprolinase family protein [Pseudonocardia acaciae]|uniref:hydantoinase B/oxoprolinase family protein n=1 Tax=Pseudonocardia acaciae TaxID=551276 RepID=UPI0007E8CEB0|nr:hydantoinase B/oxoprolinase family protein [Pseudonocardia acaciae]